MSGKKAFQWIPWEGAHHVHSTLLHVDILDGKLWILLDQTPDGLAPDLVDACIPKDRIVLGFKSPARRAITGYATA